MRKKRTLSFILILLVLALVATLSFACGKVDEPEETGEGRLLPVSAGASEVYAAMLAADGSKEASHFSLIFNGSYVAGEKTYDFDFKGAFDISEVNLEDDKRTQLSFEVKQGGSGIFRLYSSNGYLYLDFPPYAQSARLADFNVAKSVSELHGEKERGTLKAVLDSLPVLASSIFDSCRLYSEAEGDRYVFTLSYPQLIGAVSAAVEGWDAGFSSGELFSALHLTDAQAEEIAASEAATTLTVLLKDGLFLSAEIETDEKSIFKLNEFSLTSGTAELALPAALSAFEEFDFGNLSLSGTLHLTTQNSDSARSVNYGVTVERNFGETDYAFDYTFKSHYVAGSGYEFALDLTDKNGKESRFQVKGEYLYVDLFAYGIQKFKLKTDDLSEKLGTAGFKDVGEFTFKDKVRMLTLLAMGRKEGENVVTYELGSEFFSLLSEKIGFCGLFGVNGGTLSVGTLNNKMQSLSASLTIGDMTAALSVSFAETENKFGKAKDVTIPDPTGDYYDFTTRESTHISATGTLSPHISAFDNEGEYLSAVLSSLADTDLTCSAEGAISYTADLVYGATGAVSRFFARLYATSGGRTELATLYYTADTAGVFYLIYPAERGVSKVSTFTLPADPLARFNALLGASTSEVGKGIFLSGRETSFTIGVYSPMLSFIEEKLALLYPDFSLSSLTSMTAKSYELKITESLLTGKIVFDPAGEDYLTITATEFDVTFGDSFDVTSFTATTPTSVAILADNDMPESATATFTGGLTYVVSLKNAAGEKLWRYTGAPEHVGAVGATTDATATVTLFGKTITARITVDISPVESVELSSSETYGEKFDVNTNTFRFNRYNDASPTTVLGTFSDLTLVMADGSTFSGKAISSWDTTSVSTSGDETDFTVKPKVRTYFGNEIYLGDCADFTLHVDGAKVESVDYEITFVAYDGRDPSDPAVYGSAVNVQTTDGKRLTVQRVEWVLDRIATLKREHPDRLYEYSNTSSTEASDSSTEASDRVTVKVYDFTGNYISKEVPVRFEAKVVEKVTFDLSAFDGVSYSEGERNFTFDVLKVRGIDPTRTAGVLPSRFVANSGMEHRDEFAVAGLQWSFDKVENVSNTMGKTGTLTMTIGDDISGHQTINFSYCFTSLSITETALLSAEGAPIPHTGTNSSREGLYSYTFSHLSTYTYAFPKYVRAVYGSGESDYEDIEMKWSYDKTFLEDNLWEGGTYVLTGALGSETVTVTMTFDRKRITSYRFCTAEDGKVYSASGKVLKVNGTALSYSALGALSSDGSNYALTEDYPARIEVAFNGETHYEAIDVTWDLSVLTEKENIIDGFPRDGDAGTVLAKAKGQSLNVPVFVSAVVGDYHNVYLDSSHTQKSKTFRLLEADGASGYTIVDPTLRENYPSELYIVDSDDNEYPVPVAEWLDLDKVTAFYTTELNKGVVVNKIKTGTTPIVVKAKIGNETVGYKEISVEVHIAESTISEIRVTGIPYAPTTEQTGGISRYAITPTYESGTEPFRYELSLDINPYYVNPKPGNSAESYPRYVEFKLNGIFVRVEAAWDLTEIPKDAATATETKTYRTYAMIDGGFENILIPVAVNVLKREIDKVWIDGSSQKYIDLDPYSPHPFGTNLEGDIVTREVQVQFRGDANKYRLNMKYSKEGIVLSYDGSTVYENVIVEVGNEAGGYREIGGYQIRMISKIVSKIDMEEDFKEEEGKGKPFYEMKISGGESSGSSALTYEYNKVLDMAADDLPTVLSITFGIGTSPVNVLREDQEGALTKGVVFKWVSNEMGVGVVLWNPTLDESVGGVKQAYYNAKQNNYNTPKYNMFFDDSAWDDLIYRDGEDKDPVTNLPLEAITAASVIEHYREGIKTDKVVADEYYVTADAEDAARLGGDTPLDAGVYRLYVSVSKDAHYRGKVYKTFEIARKDISAYVVLSIGGAYNVTSGMYKGTPYALEAVVNTEIYSIEVSLLLGGKPLQQVTNVVYEDPQEYVFSVTVAAEVKNYTVTKELRFKITEASLFANDEEAAGRVDATFAWTGTTFVPTVTLDGAPLEKAESESDLTNGFVIKYYQNADDEEEVTSFEAGAGYYYTVIIKKPNYVKYIMPKGYRLAQE